MTDLDDNRLEYAKRFGTTEIINSGNDDAVKKILAETKDGVDVAIEAVGIPATFDVCRKIVRPGGRIANVDVLEREGHQGHHRAHDRSGAHPTTNQSTQRSGK